MNQKHVALLIEDNPDDAELTRLMLAEARYQDFSLEWVASLAAGLRRVAVGGVEVVLLDLGLSDSAGLDTLGRLRAGCPQGLAVVVLSGHGDEQLGMEAVQAGAQDYLVKGEITAGLLIRSMRYAIERQQSKEALMQARAELENQVQERTAKLASALDSLRKENVERERMEQGLWESSQMLKLVLDSMPAFVFWKDRNCVYLGCNRLFATNAGLSRPEEVIGLTDLDMPWKSTHAEGYRADDRRVMESGIQKLSYEETQRIADGRVIDVRTSKIPLRNSNGDVIGVLGAFEDITESKRVKQELAEAEAKYRCLVEDSLVGVYLLQQGRFVYANACLAEIFGYRQEELWNRPAEDLVAPEDRFIVSSNVRRRETGELPRIQYAFRGVRKDGTVIDVEVLGTRTIYNGMPAVIGSLLNVTERKRAEQQLRALNEELELRVADRTRELRLKTAFLEAQSNSTIDGILVVDQKGDLIFQNRRNIELFKIPPHIVAEKREETQFRWLEESLLDPQHFSKRVTWLRSHPDEAGRDEIELKDGTILDLYSAPVIGDEGLCYGRIWSFRDITQRKRAEQKAEESLKTEVILRREIHHRVKNNLQVIISLLYLQSTKVSDPNALTVLRESQNRVRAIALVHEMLYHREDLSKISFNNYVRQLAADLFISYRVNQRDVVLKVESDGVFLGLHSAIPCGIIVTELMTNALKYAFPDGRKGEINVSLLPVADSGKLELTVRDSGVGLPRGFEAKRAQTMGLSLVHDLTRQLEGVVEFGDNPSEPGTVVRIIFPSHWHR